MAGEHAAGLAMEGRCEGTARVTTHVLPMEEEPVGGQIPRSRGATLTCVLVSFLIPVCRRNEPFHLVIIAIALSLAYRECPK